MVKSPRQYSTFGLQCIGNERWPISHQHPADAQTIEEHHSTKWEHISAEGKYNLTTLTQSALSLEDPDVFCITQKSNDMLVTTKLHPNKLARELISA